MKKTMNLAEVKDRLCEWTERFFPGATVIWSEQINTKPPLPYVTLKVSGIRRTSFPVEDDDGNRYYQCGTTWEVNLYTKGKLIGGGKNATGNYANTAMSDLNEFASFLESEYITDEIAGYGMDVSLMPPVRDLTELQNDSKYRYRSMAEFTVSYAEEANGPYGLGGMPMVPNSSGGGTADMSEATTDVIEEIEIVEDTE